MKHKFTIWQEFQNHPEIQPGEVWVTNVFSRSIGSSPRIDAEEAFERVPWKTKRMATLAFDSFGVLLKEGHAVFAQKSEIEQSPLFDGFTVVSARPS